MWLAGLNRPTVLKPHSVSTSHGELLLESAFIILVRDLPSALHITLVQLPWELFWWLVSLFKTSRKDSALSHPFCATAPLSVNSPCSGYSVADLPSSAHGLAAILPLHFSL